MSEETKAASGDVVEKRDGTRTIEQWEEGWKEGRIGFHSEDRHPKLVRYVDKLVNGREQIKFFFPLCGKTVDMKWMYDEGHTVVGVEATVMAIEEFFLENDVTYVAEAVPEIDGSIYKSLDNRLRLYHCDLFKFSPNVEKDFGAIFDRGSLVAINKEDRVRYADLIVSLMSPDARYMLLTFEYDVSKYKGPPHSFVLEDLDALYGSRCNMELVNVEDAMEERHRGWGLDTLDERVQLLTPK